ncbi:MAG: hypothetical protein WC707_05140 [Candidatus Babeliaceae bacterium]|jgi:hypothetical protein
MPYLKNFAWANKTYFLICLFLSTTSHAFFHDLDQRARQNIAQQDYLEKEARIRAERDAIIYREYIVPIMILLKAGWRVTLSTGKFGYLLVTDPEIACKKLVHLHSDAIIGCAGLIIIAGCTIAYIRNALRKNYPNNYHEYNWNREKQ